ncbi:hypothetical protein [Flavobacterium sp. AG291]|uniref:hypothetical protein n=1 Tax=Flavobacterium sp. AG291 TaxID=2184000 RepID=UPI000E0A81A7|nr:hypothetical protein [Flavobacterium sp. AG291]RDI05825.1 hypothetical protein DEU42_11579 [Flavobacterium sp. AG291]
MKKIILPVLLLAGMTTVNAQNIYDSNGSLTSNRTLTLGSYSLAFKPTSTTNGLFLASSGNVGINTTTPVQKLDVNGNVQAVQGYFTNAVGNADPNIATTFIDNADRVNKSLVLNAGYKCSPVSNARTFIYMDMPKSQFDTAPTIWFALTNRNDMTRFRFYAPQDGKSAFSLYDKSQTVNFTFVEDSNNNNHFAMPKENSYVTIGSSNYGDPATGELFKLSVNGNVRADRIKVYNTWADYVFEDSYKLPTLEEVEKHIKEKGHLIDIPSAKEVEVKGIDLGDMNRLLMQKVEELTLYMIEQNKVNEKQAQVIELLEKKIERLEKGN